MTRVRRVAWWLAGVGAALLIFGGWTPTRHHALAGCNRLRLHAGPASVELDDPKLVAEFLAQMRTGRRDDDFTVEFFRGNRVLYRPERVDRAFLQGWLQARSERL